MSLDRPADLGAPGIADERQAPAEGGQRTSRLARHPARRGRHQIGLVEQLEPVQPVDIVERVRRHQHIDVAVDQRILVGRRQPAPDRDPAHVEPVAQGRHQRRDQGAGQRTDHRDAQMRQRATRDVADRGARLGGVSQELDRAGAQRDTGGGQVDRAHRAVDQFLAQLALELLKELRHRRLGDPQRRRRRGQAALLGNRREHVQRAQKIDPLRRLGHAQRLPKSRFISNANDFRPSRRSRQGQPDAAI